MKRRLISLLLAIVLLANMIPWTALSASAAAALEITRQPEGMAAASGERVSTTIVASGDGLTYQWYIKNPGKTSYSKSSLTSDTYSYTMSSRYSGRRVYCRVTDQNGDSVKTKSVVFSRIEITSQPQDDSAVIGEKASTTVKASGKSLTYQWYVRDPGAQGYTKSAAATATYRFTMTEEKSGREVYCRITDAYGNWVDTEIARFTAQTPAELKITGQPQDAAAAPGTKAETTVTAEGDGLTYQWYVKNPGKSVFSKSSIKTATYVCTMTASVSGRKVYCVVTDKYGSKAVSDTATLTMESSLKITGQPQDASAAPGTKVTATVSAEGEGLTYQWYLKNPGKTAFSKSSITSATYSCTMTAAVSGRQVYCVITDKYGSSVTSDTVVLSLKSSLRITGQPQDAAAAAGAKVSTAVSAEGEGLTYQWYVKNPGKTAFTKSSITSATYSCTMTAAISGRQVYCVVTDKYGSRATSDTAVLKLTPPEETEVPFSIKGITCSASGTVTAGSMVIWTVETAGGSRPIQYQFTLLKDNAVAAEQTYSTRNYFTGTLGEAGSYILYITCRDAEGNECGSLAETVAVGGRPLTITKVTGPAGVFVEGDALSWTVGTENGAGTVRYTYELMLGGTVIANQEDSEKDIYRHETRAPGIYSLHVTCRDEAGTLCEDVSETVLVYSVQEAVPAVPELLFADGEKAFSAETSAAPLYEAQSIFVEWKKADNAQSYRVRLDRRDGEEWTSLVSEETLRQNSYKLSSSLFEDLEGAALYRFRISAVGIREGETGVSYFRVVPETADDTITVDGQSAITWNQAHAYASSERTFQIASQLSWEAYTDADWLTVEKRSDDTLAVTIQAMTEYRLRSTELTVTNGVNTVVITIRQSRAQQPPVILSPAGLSTDPARPSEYPVGDFTIYWDTSDWGPIGKYRLRVTDVAAGDMIYEKTFNNNETEDLKASDMKKAFEANKVYAIEIAGFYGSSYATCEVEADALKSVHYVRMVNRGHSITVNGETAITLSDISREAVYVKASNFFSYTSDVDWITNSGTSSKMEQKITVRAEENTTGAARTGHLTFTCGTAKAVVTVTQDASQSQKTDFVYLVQSGQSEPEALKCVNLAGKATKSSKFVLYASGQTEVSSNADWISLDENHRWSGDSFDSGDSFYLYLKENTTDSVRTGTVTVSCGTTRKTITISQVPAMGAVKLLSPALSENYTNPNVIAYEDMTVSFAAVKHAVKYEISASNTRGVTGSLTGYILEETGKSQYTCVIPREWLLPASTTAKYSYLTIDAFDAYGYSVGKGYYFVVSESNVVLLNGSSSPVWEKVTDMGVEKAFSVQAMENWTATASQSWITLSAASGAPGGSFTVRLAENTDSAARSGQVRVRSGAAETVLEITQCAMSPRDFVILTPSYSDLEGSPTMVPANTSSVYVSWPEEPQSVFRIRLRQQGVGEIAASGTLDQGQSSHTFANLTLKKGELYYLDCWRSSERWGNTRFYSDYFTISDENAWVKADDSTDSAWLQMDAAADEDCSRYTITSSGTWGASVDADWVMVAKERVDQEDLDKYGETPDMYRTVSGASGEELFVNVLANPTSQMRTATVTVQCAGATLTIPVVQYPSYSRAELVRPTFSPTPSEVVRVSCGDLTLRWNPGEGGTGKYELELYESETNGRGYTRIFRKTGIAGTSYTIPAEEFTEGMYYRLWLGTEIAEGVDAPGCWYYFSMDGKNALTAWLTLSENSATVGVHTSVTVTASGGAGGYWYAFQLMQGTKVIEETAYQTGDWHSFAVPAAGEYYFRVYVRDAAGAVIKVDSRTVTAAEQKDTIRISETFRAVAAEGETFGVDVHCSGTWTATPGQSWLTVARETSATAIAVAENTSDKERTGTVTFTAGDSRAVLKITQSASAAGSAESTLTLSDSVWSLEKTTGAMMEMTLRCGGAWSVTEKPDWVTVVPASGTGDAVVNVYAQANTDISRMGSVTFTSGSVSKTLTVSQPGNDIGFRVTGFTVSKLKPLTGETVTFKITAPEADQVVLVVDGVSYDSVPVENGTATLKRSFSSGGVRQVSFIPWQGSVQGMASGTKELNVVSYGELAAPAWTFFDTARMGEAKPVDWQDVPNAQEYVVRILRDGEELLRETTTRSQWEIPARITSWAGTYMLLIMATGKGWTQSEAGMIFTVNKPQKDFSITAPGKNDSFVCADLEYYLKASNPSGHYLAFKVVRDGTVTYYPETGTFSQTDILCKAPIQGTGTYEVTLEAYPTADRSGTCWASAGPVAFKVNGPLKLAAYIGQQRADKNMFVSNADSVYVRTNNATDHIDVYLDGVLLTTLNRNDPAECTADGYQYIFRSALTLPQPGYRTYRLHAVDVEGNAADWTLSYYMMTRTADRVMYPNGSAGITMRRYPDSTSTVLASDLYPCIPITVQAEYGAYYYGGYDGHYGFIPKDRMQAQRGSTWQGLTLDILENDQARNIWFTGQEAAIRFQWKSSVETLHSAVCYKLYLVNKETVEKHLLYSGSGTEYKSTVSAMKQYLGTHTLLLELVTTDGQTVYASAQSRRDYTITENIALYTNDGLNGNFTYWSKRVMNCHDILMDAHNVIQKMELEKLTDNMLIDAYYSGSTGDVLTPLGLDSLKHATIAENILSELAPGDVSSVTVDANSLQRIFNFLKMPVDAADMLRTLNGSDFQKDVLKLGKKDAALPEILEDYMKDNPSKLGTLADGLTKGLSIGDALATIIAKYSLYTSVNDKELNRIITSLEATSNADLKGVAEYLRMMSSDGALVAYLCAGVLTKEAGKALVGTAGDIAASLIVKLPGGYALAAGAKIGVAIGTSVNNLLFNTDKVLETAYQLEWIRDIAKSYYGEYSKARAAFYKFNETQNYAAYARASQVFAQLVKTEYDFLEAYFKETGGSDSDFNNIDILSIRGNDLLRAIDDYYYNVLAPLGVEHVILYY